MSDRPGAKKIVVAGYFGFDNTGDEAILGILLEDLRSELAGFEIVVASGNPEQTSAAYGVKSISYTNVSALVSEVESSDAVMFGGGGIFHDYWGCDPDLSLTAQHTGIAYYHSLVLLSALREKPLVINAVGVGPLLSEAGRNYTRMAFEQASQASVRDQESKEVLVSAGVDPDHVKVSADPAFRVSPIPSDQTKVILKSKKLARSSRLLIGVTPREWHIGASVEQWGREVAAALDNLIERQKATVMFLPFQCLESDLTNDHIVSLMIRSYMRHQGQAIVLTGNYTVQEKMGLLAQCDVVLGMRLHSIIFAANAGVPTVALVYDPKIESVMKQLKCAEFAVAIDTLEGNKLVERVMQARKDRDDLKGRLLSATTELAHSARENNLFIVDWLRSGPVARFTLAPEQVRLAATNAISLVNDREKVIGSLSAEVVEKESVIVERDKAIQWLRDESKANDEKNQLAVARLTEQSEQLAGSVQLISSLLTTERDKIATLEARLAEEARKNDQLQTTEHALVEKEQELRSLRAMVLEKGESIESLSRRVVEQNQLLHELAVEDEESLESIGRLAGQLAEKERQLAREKQRQVSLSQEKDQIVATLSAQLVEKEKALERTKGRLAETETRLDEISGANRTVSTESREQSMEELQNLLLATPNPTQGGGESGLGAVTLTWNAAQATDIEIRVDAPDGSLLAQGGAGGSVTTPDWVADGTIFYLQNVTGGLPLTSENTLASVKVWVDPIASVSLLATPNPISVYDGSGFAALTLTWKATQFTDIEIRLNAPDGELLVQGGGSGSAAIPKWVKDGTTFYLQNVMGGLPLTAENTLASVTVEVESVASGSMLATPNPIPVYDASGLAATTLTWNATDATEVEVRVNAPDGGLVFRGGASGIIDIPGWVRDGTTFYLQNVSGGLPLTAENTLATTTVSVMNMRKEVDSLFAIPNPIRLYLGSSLGATTIVWDAIDATEVELRLGACDGPLIFRGRTRGAITTSECFAERTIVYLQNISDGLPLTPENTLATLTVEVTKVAVGSLLATPNPVHVKDDTRLGTTTLRWKATNCADVEIRAGAPDGDLLVRGGDRGSLITPEPVADGTVFYLQNVSGGLPLTSANTLDTVKVMVGKQQALPSHNPKAIDVICFSIVDWDFRYQRPQQIMAQFAAHGHRVFYLSCTQTLPDHSSPRVQARMIKENVWEVRLAAQRLPNVYGEVVDGDNKSTLLDSLEELRRTFKINEAVAYVMISSWTDVALEVRERFGWSVIYDCMDEWENFPGIQRPLLDGELKLVKECDLLVVTAQTLYEKWQGHSRRMVLARNAVDYEFYVANYAPNSLLTDVKYPIIGYYGAIADWFDMELMIDVALQRPDYTFVLLGGLWDVDTSALAALPNVHLLGLKPYETMPQYLYHFDVCMIPFKINPITEATDPVKVYEYLSAGKPVVSVALPELSPCSEYIYIAKDRDDFVAQLDRAVMEEDDDIVARRISFASRQTWSERYERIVGELSSATPRASIVIVTYNNLELNKLCLESVLRNTHYPNYEVIVVDNDSTDGTRAYLRYMAAQHSQIQIILNQNNEGFARANNQGIAQSTGDYLVLLNNDTIVPSGWLSRLLRHLENPSIGMVGPVTNFVGNEAKIAVPYQDWADMEQFAREHMWANDGKVADIYMLAMFCVAFRRETYELVGPLDEQFGIGMFEDDDYSVRMKRSNLRLICAADVFVHHFGQAAFKKLIERGEYDDLFNRNRRRYEAKWNIQWVPHQNAPLRFEPLADSELEPAI